MQMKVTMTASHVIRWLNERTIEINIVLSKGIKYNWLEFVNIFCAVAISACLGVICQQDKGSAFREVRWRTGEMFLEKNSTRAGVL